MLKKKNEDFSSEILQEELFLDLRQGIKKTYLKYTLQYSTRLKSRLIPSSFFLTPID
jgi:hypothetical protein